MNALIGALAGLAAAPLVLAGIGRSSCRPGRRSHPATVAVALGCATAGGWAAGWSAGEGQVPAAWWVLLVAGVALAVVDVVEHRLPDLLVGRLCDLALDHEASATNGWLDEMGRAL